MNKGGPGGGGPTAAAAAAAAQKQKTLLQRVEGDIANIVDNFSHLVNVARVCVYLYFL
jgi:mediator of RNA polymerase II transcription subunit 22